MAITNKKTASIPNEVAEYANHLSTEEQEICSILYKQINSTLKNAENKI